MNFISKIFNFDDIGTKIKKLAKWSCWIEILLIWIFTPIALIILLSDSYTSYLWWVPILVAVFAPIIIWINAWVIYAFGEFVEDTHAMRYSDQQEDIDNTIHNQAKTIPTKKLEYINNSQNDPAIEKNKKENADSKNVYIPIYDQSIEKVTTCDFCGKKSQDITVYKKSGTVFAKDIHLNLCTKCAKKHDFFKN